MCKQNRPTLTQCCPYVGPPCATLAQHYTNVMSAYRVHRVSLFSYNLEMDQHLLSVDRPVDIRKGRRAFYSACCYCSIPPPIRSFPGPHGIHGDTCRGDPVMSPWHNICVLLPGLVKRGLGSGHGVKLGNLWNEAGSWCRRAGLAVKHPPETDAPYRVTQY